LTGTPRNRGAGGAGGGVYSDALPQVDATIGPEAIRTLRDEVLLGTVLPQVYVTSGQIAMVERVSGTAGADAGDEDAPLPVVATTVTPPVLAHLLARHTYTYRHTAKGGREEYTPPREVLAAALAPSEWPGVPALHGIIGAPVLRRDGTLLQTPGYDPATGLYLAPTVQLDPSPSGPHPSRCTRRGRSCWSGSWWISPGRARRIGPTTWRYWSPRRCVRSCGV
jgi:hypothetical protein